MKNVFTEVKTLIAQSGGSAQIGVISSRAAGGGYYATNSKGSTILVSGTADIGDTVLFKDGQILSRIQTETAKRYYIK